MTKSIQDIIHTRGDTFIRSLLFSDSLGQPINLTGSTIAFTIKKNYDDTTAKISVNATIDANPATGKSTINISATMMKTLAEVYDYYYDLQWTDSTGVVQTVCKGRFLNTYDVTA